MSKVYKLFLRNKYDMNGKKVYRNKVVLENWQGRINVGDALAPVIYRWMLAKKNISPEQRVLGIKHLMTIGSIIVMGERPFDATIWGSGLLNEKTIHTLTIQRLFRKLDIRAVRGPITRNLLQKCGYDCPQVYGDPGILMPLIYHSTEKKVKGKISVIRHFRMADLNIEDGYFKIDPRTDNYQNFIDQICSSEKVISSSLHGIILAESYGIPAIFLQEGMEDVLLKFYDWYYSTGRKNIKIAYSVDEAAKMTPMELPQLDFMQKALLNCFPYDLFGK